MSLVIFDMDGTVIDTIQDIHSSLLTTLEHYGLPHVSLDMTKQYVGSGMRKLVINAVGEHLFKDEMETYFRTIYKDRMMDNTAVIKGFQPVFELIERRTDIQTAILSNKNRQIVDDMIQAFRLQQYFDQWYGGDSYGVKKPAPDGVIGIMSEFDSAPSETLMIGDSSGDILAGKSAGAKTCFCTYGYGTLKNVTADYTADSPADILAILEDLK
jgi:phosphoglycolate phosphatase